MAAQSKNLVFPKGASASSAITAATTDAIVPFFARAIESVREEMLDSSYVKEALRVLPVGGFRSAIGSIWNAVVDDLRNKIIHRSLELFNKELSLGHPIKTYEDFQNYVNDDQLIEGAYKIGVIGWEASKVLKHAKETRHIFDGHPKSSDPSELKVLSMVDDCVKYVLSQPAPPQIINIQDYLAQMASPDYDRNDIAIDNALSELPETYKNELANRLFSTYIHDSSSSILRSNIEFAIPILWNVLPKEVKNQVVRRVDQEITAGNASKTGRAFDFVIKIDGQRFLSAVAKRYKIAPLVMKLKSAEQSDWNTENECVAALVPFAAYIPENLLHDYVRCLVMTYVGYIGNSSSWSRTDFYANGAAMHIPKMLQAFDDNAASAFIESIKGNTVLRKRIVTPVKLQRLRSLGRIVLEKVSDSFPDKELLEALVNPEEEDKFLKLLDKQPKH